MWAAATSCALAACGSGAADRPSSPTGGDDASVGCAGAGCEGGATGTPAGEEGGAETSSTVVLDAGGSPPQAEAGAPQGEAGSGNEGGGPAPAGGLPALTVQGSKLVDPTGKTIVLRGSSLIDIGSLYANGGGSASGITARLDRVAATSVQGHVVRMPVYPKITYNGTAPTCSPTPYPVGTGPAATCTPKTPLSAADYVNDVLKPAVDYATSKGLYVIVDFHQIDNATTGNSAADANTFWADIAPRFSSYANVLYEPFNEPIDTMAPWSALKPVVQGLIDTIRAGAPNNVIIVPSNAWDQHPGDAAADPPSGANLMYTAHIYPSNWKAGFQAQVAAAVTMAPVFITEWGYAATDPNPHAWGTTLQSLVDGDGASWTAWVTDNAWQPNMFVDKPLTQLTDFGTLVQTWLAAKTTSDWVQ